MDGGLQKIKRVVSCVVIDILRWWPVSEPRSGVVLPDLTALCRLNLVRLASTFIRNELSLLLSVFFAASFRALCPGCSALAPRIGQSLVRLPCRDGVTSAVDRGGQERGSEQDAAERRGWKTGCGGHAEEGRTAQDEPWGACGRG